MISYFVWISAFVFAFLFLLWGKGNWLNFIIKMFFLIMMVMAIIIIYKETGFTKFTFS